jgi:hypothetical protein
VESETPVIYKQSDETKRSEMESETPVIYKHSSEARTLKSSNEVGLG